MSFRRFRPQLETLEDRWLPSTLTVTSAADSGRGSLRADIAAAHSGDTIIFAPKLDGQTITLTSGELVINKSLTIQGPSASQVTIDAQHKSRIFDISTGQPVVLSNLTIRNGLASSSGPGGGYGGAILNYATLTLNGCTIANSGAGFGGGIDNGGTLTANNCDFTGDAIWYWSNGGRYYGGGAILNQATMTLTGCTIQGNGDSHPGTAGAGIDNEGKLTVNSCNISGNNGSSAVFNKSTLTISGSTIDGNSSGGNGGGIFNAGTLTASDCAIDGNTADGYYGGGVCAYGTVTLTNCTLSNNKVLYGDQLPTHTGGGGLYAGGTVALTNCTLANNAVAGSGGGLFVRNSVTLTNCTLSGNSAGYGGYANDGGYGGGIYVQPGFSNLNLTNTLVAGNSIKQSASGGPDIYGVVTTADHNLVGNATGSSGIVNGINGNLVGGNGNPVLNAELGPLQNNGGPTETMTLLSNSPAIGLADNSKAPTIDQRGVTRLDEAGETTDIGAFEL